MPLTWNIKDIEMYKDDVESAYIEVEEYGRKGFDLNPVTKTLVFWGGVAGYSNITKSNAAEYYARSRVVEELCKTSFMVGWRQLEDGNHERYDIHMAMDDVRNHIGLSTNHSTYSTNEWIDIFVNNHEDVATPAKVIKAMITLYKHEYEKWEKTK
jgi:hypothetical protein